ncbi:hypothetical protein HYN59_00985 [Flavobacterium album]|uniref:Uncharacterized protein n=2 Tax=Flavobacterium album TaxID=2175091 RepID=A0A2S1QTQ8_9FLAO|nr:hypothetical protein HYN59_00985 [Flavobacterium album]
MLANIVGAQQAQTRANPATALSPKAMEAYELKAESKAGEFFNYVELLTDPTANAEMKTQTTAEAAKLYENDGITIENIFDAKGNVVTVKKLLELAASQKQKASLSMTTFNIMKRGENSRRKDWLMTYELIIGKRVLTVSQGFYIVLEDKKFGTTIKQVWNSYLGEMRIIKK